MKKIIFIFALFVSTALGANAQIYTHKRVLDKFDDTLLDKDIKTLVEKTDSTFIIEEKGSAPVVYTILNFAAYNSMGDKDNIVNLVDDIYGYQECWCVVPEKDAENYYNDYFACFLEKDESKRNDMLRKLVYKYSYYIVHRVITTQYAHVYKAEYFWIQKGEKNGRTVYFK